LVISIKDIIVIDSIDNFGEKLTILSFKKNPDKKNAVVINAMSALKGKPTKKGRFVDGIMGLLAI